MSVFNGEE